MRQICDHIIHKPPHNATMTDRRCCLWIGGSSGLARTYFNAHGSDHDEKKDEWILMGKKEVPDWQPNEKTMTTYLSLNLRQYTDAQLEHVVQKCAKVQDILVGIRPVLVSPQSLEEAWQTNAQLLQGLQRLLEALISSPETKVERILHVSSIAAVHHIERQCLRSETSHRDPRSDELENPYDRFKRATEEMVLRLTDNRNRKRLLVTNVRLGAIFSDDPRCIQCAALGLQSRFAVYLPTRIDCNSSKNVATLLHLMLTTPGMEWRPVYYYTRPLHLSSPVPYGDYLRAYQRAYGLTHWWSTLWIPQWLVTVFVTLVHLLATTLAWLQNHRTWTTTLVRRMARMVARLLCLEHVDYLLQVTVQEHTFDLTAVGHDFPALLPREEGLVECFVRRRQVLATASA